MTENEAREYWYRRVKAYLNCKPWMCQCGCTNFGRNTHCALCKLEKPEVSDVGNNQVINE